MSPDGYATERSAAAEPRSRCLFSDIEHSSSTIELVSYTKAPLSDDSGRIGILRWKRRRAPVASDCESEERVFSMWHTTVYYFMYTLSVRTHFPKL